VLDEVIALFPAPYIHVGGDECPKVSWKKCPKCQQRIKDNQLKDEHELQSYFIQRIEKYVNSKGKQIIGWDEILEGGLAPNATVMSWRGEKGGIAAAQQHHKVIMTPSNYVYLDHAQKRNEDSVNIGGYLPLETVYKYEPLPKDLSEAEQNYIIGAQANVWTEYMGNIPKVEYMLFPRISALSEVLWSPKDARDWDDFQKRLPVQFKRYELWKSNFSHAYYDLRAEILPASGNHGVLWKLDSKSDPKNSRIDIINHISSDTMVTNCNSSEILVDSDRSFEAKLFVFDQSSGEVSKELSHISQQFYFNLATGKNIALTTPPATEFPGNGGAFGLVNGAKTESPGNFTEWLGWVGSDMEATIDLGSACKVSSVSIHTMDQKRGRFYRPLYMEVQLSVDGNQYKTMGRAADYTESHDNFGDMTLRFPSGQSRFVRIVAKNQGTIPEGQPGSGNPARMLIDEIQVL
jgi:hexosaminidase